jgi:ubiquinone/menaquinone biosynthesis C-methylase UbiE
VNEFTGERVIPGEVNDDLWAEHLARYAFAARYAAGKRALDIGCGTGYGAAELARRASAAFGIDVAADPLAYARSHYPATHFTQASAASLPFRDASFDIVTAFEVIEHLRDSRALLAEARRVLTPDGVFLVSTPNKTYYAEARAKDGPNPFHTHEFEFEEFQAALADVFPHVTMFLQNWQGAVSFVPASTENYGLDATIASSQAAPGEAHFFLAVCFISAPCAPGAFLYVPSASNLLREREQHIRLLETELAQSKRWLDDARWERDAMIALQSAQKHQLEESNRWAQHLEIQSKATLERIARVQNELHAAQARAADVAADYARKVGELEQENLQKTEWALDIEQRLSADLAARCDELAETVRLLDRAETTVIERTQWAQRVQARVDQLETLLKTIRESKWIKIGRAAGLGPRVDG